MPALRQQALACGTSWLALVALATTGVAAPAGEPACRAEAELEPAEAWVGQQVLHRIRIARREEVEAVEWLRPPAFPGLRAERLPPRAERHASETGYRKREERRALFALRPGSFTLPPAILACTITGRSAPAQRVEVAAVRLRASPPPAEGRPADFQGLIGPLQLLLQASADELRLGQSLHLELSLRGPGDLSVVGSLLEALERLSPTEDVDWFHHPAQLSREPGERLLLRRTFHADWVPRREGQLQIPALSVSYFDPVHERYARATTTALSLHVGPAAPGVLRGGGPRSRDAAPAPATRDSQPGIPGMPLRGRLAKLLAGCFALASLGGAIAWGLQRRRWRGVASALASAAQARVDADGGSERAALVRALRAALRIRAPELAGLEGSAFTGARPEEPTLALAAQLLERLERERFSPDPLPLADAERLELERCLQTLRRWRPRWKRF
jgi:hypothetical protein